MAEICQLTGITAVLLARPAAFDNSHDPGRLVMTDGSISALPSGRAAWCKSLLLPDTFFSDTRQLFAESRCLVLKDRRTLVLWPASVQQRDSGIRSFATG